MMMRLLRAVANCFVNLEKDQMKGAFLVEEPLQTHNALTGEARIFRQGETVITYSNRSDENITIEANYSYYVVDRPEFERCCKWNNDASV